MHAIPRRTMLSFSLFSLALASSGCFGSFAATRKLWHFNDEISGNKWIKWLLFLVLIILPVYGLFALGDAIIFNTIEFFTDKNPLSADTRDLGNGVQVAYERDRDDRDLVRLEVRRDGVTVGVWYVKRTEDGFRLLDEQRKLLSDSSEVDGELRLTDGSGKVLAQLDAEAQASAAKRMKATGSPQIAVAEAIGGVDRVARIGVARTL